MTDALRPLTTGELLDRTFFYYRRHFVLFVGIAAVPSVVMLLMQLLFLFGSPAPGILATLVVTLASFLMFLATTAFAQGATVVAVSQIQLGREASVADSFATIRPHVGNILATIVVVGLIVGLGTVFFIIPGILLALRYALAVPVAVLEDRSVGESLWRSEELTRGNRGRVFIIYLLVFVLTAIATLTSQGAIVAAIAWVSGTIRLTAMPLWGRAAIQFGAFVSRAILSPVMTIALALVYYDERVRKEAFDLEHMLQQLEAPRANPAPSA